MNEIFWLSISAALGGLAGALLAGWSWGASIFYAFGCAIVGGVVAILLMLRRKT